MRQQGGRTARRGTLVLGALAVFAAAGCDDLDKGSPILGPETMAPQYVVTSNNYTYTLDAQFDEGTLVNVNHDAPNSNQLQLNQQTGTFPFIWVALSQRCTIAKINTATGAILGEYRTIADGVGCNQSSRTTVGIDGSVWVGHRGPGGVAHVGLVELNQCFDRNGNGTIETSTGYGDVKPWPGVSPSNVANAQDECILHHVNTDAQGFGDTRHMSIDAANNLWVGSFSPKRFVRVNGTTGVMDLATLKTGFSCGGYGGLIDKDGIIWSANGGGTGLLRWNPNAPDAAGVNPRCIAIPVYGLAIDQGGWVWAGDFYSDRVRKVSPDGATILGPFAHGSYYAQGLAVDANGDVWVSSSLNCGAGCTIGHLKNSGTFVGNVANPTGAGSTGISVDADGKIWSANLNSNTATRIDPTGGAIGGDGVTHIGAVDLTVNFPSTPGRPLPYPYNYSDMTGAQLLGVTAPQGTWTVVQDGGVGAAWGTILWNTEAQGAVPAGASITVEARAAATEAGLGSETFVPIGNNVGFNLLGRFIQVRVTLIASPQGVSPVLSDLAIRSLATDAKPPACALTATGTNGTGQKYIQVTVRDVDSGLQSILVTKATNLDAVVPAFSAGTNDPVVVTATKINQALSSSLALRATDVAGNITNCDPIDVTLDRMAGKPEPVTFTGLPQAEHWLAVHNGTPGLTNLSVNVNGRNFQVAGLRDGEVRTLDIASAMKPGSDNRVSLTAVGKPGGSAWVLLHD